MMSIYITGDFHGRPKDYLNTKVFPEQKELTKEDKVIQLGDFGLFFKDPVQKYDLYWTEWIASKPFEFLFFRGNHDNKKLIERHCMWIEKYGNLVGEIKTAQGSIFYLPAGVYTINDKRVLIIPGATSVDKHLRTQDIDWWDDEVLSKQEENKILDELDAVDWKVDYVLSHTCDTKSALEILNGRYLSSCPVTKFIDFVFEKLDYKYHYFGHWHNNMCFDKSRCHYIEAPLWIDDD